MHFGSSKLPNLTPITIPRLYAHLHNQVGLTDRILYAQLLISKETQLRLHTIC